MSTLGTFDAFTAARLGIYAAQQGFRVSGNNISNINTDGYTRQRLDQVSFKAGAYDMYRSQLDNHVGSGALVMNINQIRDPYLDVRYRNVSADVGYHDTMLAGLQNIAAILDEIGKGEDVSSNEEGDGLLHAQLQDLSSKLREFAKNPTTLNDTLVRNSAQTLCYLLNDYARKLETFYEETKVDFGDQVTEVNECLKSIRDLNREIRDCEIYGDNALELRDERNRQIDKLSEYIHIKVVYSEESIGSGQTVEKLSIYLDDDNPDASVRTDESMLIDGVYGAQLYRTQKPVLNPDYDKNGPNDDTNPKYLDKDGNPTNVLDDAALEDSPNFDLSISKLLDIHEKEWTSATSERTPLTSDAFASFTIPVTSNGWSVGEKLSISGKTFEIVATGTDPLKANQITVDDANDAEKMAALIAKNLVNNDYKVTVSPDNASTLLFTARKPGEIGKSGPADPPSVTVTITNPDGTAGTATKPSFGTANQESAGQEPPAGTPGAPPDTPEVVNSYQLGNDGTWYLSTAYVKHTYEVDLDDNDLHGSLQAVRELLTERGEFTSQDVVDNIDESAASKRGIQYYQLSLDLLAKQFAEQYNKLNQGYMLNQKGNYVDKDGKELQIAGAAVNRYDGLTAAQKQELIDNGVYIKVDENGDTVPDLDAWLADSDAVPMGGPLFSNLNSGDDTTDIRAINISVSQSWTNRNVQLVPKFEVLFDGDVPNSTDNINANHMANMIEKGLLYNPKDLVPDAVSDKLFEGNFNDMFSNINIELGKDIRASNLDLSLYYTQRVEIEYSREGVSGVDLNDEAMNLMQFQKAYSAACRLMTVVDEALDRLINNTAM